MSPDEEMVRRRTRAWLASLESPSRGRDLADRYLLSDLLRAREDTSLLPDAIPDDQYAITYLAEIGRERGLLTTAEAHSFTHGTVAAGLAAVRQAIARLKA